jgi:hypothetical protein
MYKYNQGDHVQFMLGDQVCSGYISGIAMTHMPPIGPTYIVEIKTGIDEDVYPYSHMVVFECWIV